MSQLIPEGKVDFKTIDNQPLFDANTTYTTDVGFSGTHLNDQGVFFVNSEFCERCSMLSEGRTTG